MGTLTSAVAGVSGGGTLATFQFTALGAGTSGLTLSNVILIDSTLSGIAPTVQDSEVSVTAGGIPEPGSAGLLGLGLLCVWFGWGRRTHR